MIVPPAQVDKRREEGEVVPKKLERGKSPKVELSPMKKQVNQEQLQNRAKQEPPISEQEKLVKPPIRKESIPEPSRPLVELQNSAHKRLEK